jgi:hypothetical protein
MTHEQQRAPADIVNGILTWLICAVLTLRPEHRAKLIARGLSDAEIDRMRYMSAPATRVERQRAADALAPYLEAFGGGVPGFYRERGRWRMVYRPSGFLIPARDEHGFIQTLAQRIDDPEDGGKYLWLSSADRDGGASSGAPFHFANRPALWSAEELTVVEGTLKCDVCAALSGPASPASITRADSRRIYARISRAFAASSSPSTAMCSRSRKWPTRSNASSHSSKPSASACASARGRATRRASTIIFSHNPEAWR